MDIRACTTTTHYKEASSEVPLTARCHLDTHYSNVCMTFSSTFLLASWAQDKNPLFSLASSPSERGRTHSMHFWLLLHCHRPH